MPRVQETMAPPTLNLRRIYERCERCGHIELRHYRGDCPPEERGPPGVVYRAKFLATQLPTFPEWEYMTFGGLEFMQLFDVEAYDERDAFKKVDWRDFLIGLSSDDGGRFRHTRDWMGTKKPSYVWRYDRPFQSTRRAKLLHRRVF